MKRHSITAIIQNVQRLTIIDAFAGKTNHIDLICKAAVNELIRLHADEETTWPEIDMEAETNELLDAVKVICEDFNAKIVKP